MSLNTICRFLSPFRSTLLIGILLLVMNLGLLAGTSTNVADVAEALQFDRQAILDGQLWRLVTGNLVHWSPEHLALDLGVFLLLGLVYERSLRPSLLSLCLILSLAIGLVLSILLPELEIYRGLSGVDSGLFAAALAVEWKLARGDPRRWFWLLPAGAIFVIKITYECVSGQLFFGTSVLGELGLPVPLSHAAGALAAAAWIGCRPTDGARRSRDSKQPGAAQQVTVGAYDGYMVTQGSSLDASIVHADLAVVRVVGHPSDAHRGGLECPEWRFRDTVRYNHDKV